MAAVIHICPSLILRLPSPSFSFSSSSLFLSLLPYSPSLPLPAVRSLRLTSSVLLKHSLLYWLAAGSLAEPGVHSFQLVYIDSLSHPCIPGDVMPAWLLCGSWSSELHYSYLHSKCFIKPWAVSQPLIASCQGVLLTLDSSPCSFCHSCWSHWRVTKWLGAEARGPWEGWEASPSCHKDTPSQQQLWGSWSPFEKSHWQWKWALFLLSLSGNHSFPQWINNIELQKLSMHQKRIVKWCRGLLHYQYGI